MNGSLIGSYYHREGLSYCEDDNTYTPYVYSCRALACPVVLYSRLTCSVSNGDNWFEELYS